MDSPTLTRTKLKPAILLGQTCVLLLSFGCISASVFETPRAWGCGLVYLCMALCLAGSVRFARESTGVLVLAYIFFTLAVCNRNAASPMLPLLSAKVQRTCMGVFLTVAYLVCLLLLVSIKKYQGAKVKQQIFLAVLAASIITSGVSVFVSSFFLFAEPARRYWDDLPFALIVCAVSSVSVFISLSVATTTKRQSDVKLRVAVLVCTIAAALFEYSTEVRWDLYVLSVLASISAYLLFEIDFAKPAVEPPSKPDPEHLRLVADREGRVT